MNLVLVESPTKARTLSRFLGKDFQIEATMGHVRDLPSKKFGVEISKKNGVVRVKSAYEIVKGKKARVDKLKKLNRQARMVILATDPDREGEAIAWHTTVLLRKGQRPKAKGQRFSRVVFHQITKNAILEAMKHSREIDMNLVNAQQARRILDRVVGYRLSPMLWKKVRRGLSAGRVQSVAVRLIVDREREIEAFEAEEYWEIKAEVSKVSKVSEVSEAFGVKLIKIGGEKAVISSKQEADPVVLDLEKAKYQVAEVEKKEVRRRPWAPFTTSTLQQTAARLFRWSGKKTMMIAQRLYENGYITYHRTDSLSLAPEAVTAARKLIPQRFRQEFLSPKERFYKTKSKLAQEAHEAIRPTELSQIDSLSEIRSSIRRVGPESSRLYELIWKRFIATQMADQVYDQTTVDVQAQGEKNYLLQTKGQVEKFSGWRVLYQATDQPINRSTDQQVEQQLPEVKKGDPLQLIKVIPEQKFTQPPARYSEARLIKALESRGIGRPSTYAPIISTIQARAYVERKEAKFHPTPVGLVVNDFLVKYFSDIVDYDFTREMEDDLDRIATGKRDWEGVVGEFYSPFEKKLKEVGDKAKRQKIPTESTGEKCPECQKEGLPAEEAGEQVIRSGRFGKFLSCSRFPDCKFTRTYLEKIGKKCPECDGGEIIIKKTRKGKTFYGCSNYPKCNWASWRKPRSAGEPK